MLAAIDKMPQLLELADAHGAFNFTQAKVVAHHVGQVGHAHALHHGFGVVADELQALRNLVIVGDQDAALARVDVLVVIQAETPHIGQGTSVMAFVKGTRCLGRV